MTFCHFTFCLLTFSLFDFSPFDFYLFDFLSFDFLSFDFLSFDFLSFDFLSWNRLKSGKHDVTLTLFMADVSGLASFVCVTMCQIDGFEGIENLEMIRA